MPPGMPAGGIPGPPSLTQQQAMEYDATKASCSCSSLSLSLSCSADCPRLHQLLLSRKS